jgi:hypothetical protein
MTEPLREQWSRLLDGELEADSARFLLRRPPAEADADALSRYALVRACLRREEFQPAGDLADRISAALAAEPAHGAGGGRWLKPLVGTAIAAGVAALALSMAQVAPTPGPSSAGPGVAVTAPPAPAGGELAHTAPIKTRDLTPPLNVQPVADRHVSAPEPVAGPPLDPRIEDYLLRHGQATQGGVRGGLVPYVYIVATPARDGNVQADAGADAAESKR